MIAGIVPMKGLQRAKSRLRLPVSGPRKEELLVAMLDGVLDAMDGSPLDVTYVVSPDPAVLEYSRRRGARPVPEKGIAGINAAVSLGNSVAVGEGADATLVLAADVALVEAADIKGIVERGLQEERCVVAAPSLRGGTNALWRSPPEVIPTRFGENSFIKHREESLRLGVHFLQFDRDRLSLDIDIFEDLLLLVNRDRIPSRYAFLLEVLKEAGTIRNG